MPAYLSLIIKRLKQIFIGYAAFLAAMVAAYFVLLPYVRADWLSKGMLWMLSLFLLLALVFVCSQVLMGGIERRIYALGTDAQYPDVLFFIGMGMYLFYAVALSILGWGLAGFILRGFR